MSKIVVHLFGSLKRNHYLCIDNERSSRVRGEITFAEGRLRPTFIIYKGSPSFCVD